MLVEYLPWYRYFYLHIYYYLPEKNKGALRAIELNLNVCWFNL